MTKSSKEQDVKHKVESVRSPKFVELTSDRASASAELSAVMQHLRQIEQRELCQGLAHRLTEVTPWGHRPAALWVCVNSGRLFCHTSSFFIPTSRQRGSVGRKSYLNCMLHVFSNMFDRWSASPVEEMQGLMRRSCAHPFFCNHVISAPFDGVSSRRNL